MKHSSSPIWKVQLSKFLDYSRKIYWTSPTYSTNAQSFSSGMLCDLGCELLRTRTKAEYAFKMASFEAQAEATLTFRSQKVFVEWHSMKKAVVKGCWDSKSKSSIWKFSKIKNNFSVGFLSKNPIFPLCWRRYFL